MNIVIQNPDNLFYVTALGAWTAESSEALGFDNFRDAVEYFSGHKLRDVRLVLRGEDEGIEPDSDRSPSLPRPPQAFLPHPALAPSSQPGAAASSAA